MSSQTTTDREAVRKKNARTAAVSGYIGSALEYYDFFIFASAAALYLQPLFFPADAGIGNLYAIATIGVAYITRPLGALMWGHLGDKFGRKNVLLATLLLMGISTFLIGVLPTYGQIGIWATIILIVLRLAQGLSAGGESPGSASLSLEHAPDHRRGFFASWTISGVQSGIVLATLIFIPISMLPEDQLMTWGWRIPFLLSAIVTIIALILRIALEEPEVFVETKATNKVVKVPAVELFRTHGLVVLRVTAMSLYTMINTVFNIFVLAYGVNVAGISEPAMLTLIAVANITSAAMSPVYAYLSDRVGRRIIFMAGCGIQAVMIFLVLNALANGSPDDTALVYFLAIILLGVGYTMPNSVYPAYFPEQFPAQIRYSGMAISLMIGLLVAGFAPAIAQGISGPENNWLGVAIFGASACIISGIAAFLSPETFRTPKSELGKRRY